MQEQKRRHTAYHRHSQRRHDFSALLNRMLSDGSDNSLRQSLNPFGEEQVLSLASLDRKLSNEVLHSLLKLIEKEVLIIGMILPFRTLQKCWEIFGSSKQTFSSMQGISCAFLNKRSISNTNTILLMMEEEEVLGQRRVGKAERMLLNLSLALVATSRLVERRLELWEEEELLFDKHSGLLLLRVDQSPLNEHLLQRIETEFWYLQVLFEDELLASSAKPKTGRISMQRQAYQVMSEQQDEESMLLSKLDTLGEICLKRNWKISKGIMCYPFLYLLNLWIGDELDPRQLLETALLNYSKGIEEEFIKFLENLKLPLDELKLRNVVGFEKRNISLGVRKHLTMFQSIFPKFERAQKSLEGLELYFADKSRDIFEANNALASKSNLALLEKLYSQTIESKFQSSQNRSIDEFQSDFQKLLDTYGSQSLRVSSQLQTFNNFLKERKYEYLQGLGKQLQIGNKKYYSEKEELKDRLEIQTGVLETLELELRDLEDKRRKIDLENSLLKTTISQFTKKKGEPTSENNMQSRRKYLQISDNRNAKVQAKDSRGRQSGKKSSRCCCLIM